MKLEPHKFQQRCAEFGVANACAGFFLDPGLGKTVIMYMIFCMLKKMRIARRMLVVCPLRPMFSTWPAEAKKWDPFKHLKIGVLHGPCKSSVLLDESIDVHVINPEGLKWLAKTLEGLGTDPSSLWDILTVDECFPAGTLVDGRPIEDYKPGDLVRTSSGLRRVLKLGTRRVDSLVRLTLSNGRSFECTPEHPIFTDLGWVPAKRCAGRRVFDEAEVSSLPKSVPSAVRNDAASRPSEVLFSILRSETDVARLLQQEVVSGESADERSRQRASALEQGDSLAGCASKARLGEVQGSQVQEAWRERDWDVEMRVSGETTPAERVRLELCDRIGWEAAELSYLLQSGFWASRQEAGFGSGWGEPPTDAQERSGQEEGKAVSSTWVARVEDLKCPGTQVFNLTVEGCPHFFVEDTLVHNSTKFKHTDTDRFRIVKPMLEGFGRRYILTGSPAPNGLLDLFGQVYILDGGAALGRYITHYRAEYFDQDCSGFGYVPKYNAEARIYEKLRPLVIRMSQEDYLEMPPLVGACGYGDPLVRVVELPEEARKVYDKMERHLITELEDDTVTAANAAAASNKCRQIANGGLYGSAPLKQHPDERGVYDLHEVKVDAVEEIIEELQGVPALVAYEYEHDLDRLRKRFPRAPHIGGGVGTHRFAEIEREWNAGRIPVLLAQPQSVAHGLNLQATRAAVIWHSLTYDLETYEQFVRRIWRQGQKERVFVHHVIAKDTIDEVILKALQKKDRTQRALLSALREAYVA